jgi:hypothetical protein
MMLDLRISASPLRMALANGAASPIPGLASIGPTIPASFARFCGVAS